MYKKVKFEVRTEDEKLREIAKVILTKGYPIGGIFEEEIKAYHREYKFLINRNDLSDIRHDVDTLIKAGIDVREVEAL